MQKDFLDHLLQIFFFQICSGSKGLTSLPQNHHLQQLFQGPHFQFHSMTRVRFFYEFYWLNCLRLWVLRSSWDNNHYCVHFIKTKHRHKNEIKFKMNFCSLRIIFNDLCPIRWINWNQKLKLKTKNQNIFCWCKWKFDDFFIDFE